MVAGRAWNRCICDERYCPVQGKLLQPPPAPASHLSPPAELTPAPFAQLFFSEPLGELICDVQFKWVKVSQRLGGVGAGLGCQFAPPPKQGVPTPGGGCFCDVRMITLAAGIMWSGKDTRDAPLSRISFQRLEVLGALREGGTYKMDLRFQ